MDNPFSTAVGGLEDTAVAALPEVAVQVADELVGVLRIADIEAVDIAPYVAENVGDAVFFVNIVVPDVDPVDAPVGRLPDSPLAVAQGHVKRGGRLRIAIDVRVNGPRPCPPDD